MTIHAGIAEGREARGGVIFDNEVAASKLQDEQLQCPRASREARAGAAESELDLCTSLRERIVIQAAPVA